MQGKCLRLFVAGLPLVGLVYWVGRSTIRLVAGRASAGWWPRARQTAAGPPRGQSGNGIRGRRCPARRDDRRTRRIRRPKGEQIACAFRRTMQNEDRSPWSGRNLVPRLFLLVLLGECRPRTGNRGLLSCVIDAAGLVEARAANARYPAPDPLRPTQGHREEAPRCTRSPRSRIRFVPKCTDRGFRRFASVRSPI